MGGWRGVVVTQPPVPAARRPRLWPWIVTLVAGVALCVACGAVYASSTIVDLFGHTGRPTPLTMRLHLAPGTYEVFQLNAGLSGGFPLPVVQPRDVRVTDLAGPHQLGTVPSPGESLVAGGFKYESTVAFSVSHTGDYAVRVASPGTSVNVFVAPSFGTALKRGLVWVGLSVLGALVALFGLVLLIVQVVRRSRTSPRRPVTSRCANGHLLRPTDRFCATCGAPAHHGATAAPGP